MRAIDNRENRRIMVPMSAAPRFPLAARGPPAVGHDESSSLQGLLVLSMMMIESGDERHILQLAASSVPSFGPCRLEGAFIVDVGWRATSGAFAEVEARPDLEAQLAVLSSAG